MARGSNARRIAGLGDWSDFGDWTDSGGASAASGFDDYGNAVSDYGNSDVFQVNTDLPPSDPLGAGLDINKIVKTSSGLYYQYVAKQQPNGQTTYVPRQVSPPSASSSVASMQKMMLPLGIGLIAFLAMKKR